jgi:Family of unknown function (DUF5640)
MKMAALAISILLLSACGSKINGTYSDDSGTISYTFKSDGTVLMSTMGTGVELKYEVDGNKIKVLVAPQAALVLTLLDDGSIEGPMGVKLTKQKK